MTSRTLLIDCLNVALIASVIALAALARRNSQKPWVFLLFGSDVKYMTKRELLESSLRFVTWGLVFFSLIMDLGLFIEFTGWGTDTPGATMALVMVLFLFCCMGFLGGVYLFVRYLLRSKDYVPQLREHPRIAAPIRELHGAIEYMERAPDNFGGHKAQAIADCRKAIEQLRLAMQYRASQDNRRGKK